ncbi:MAG: class I SAM-dependent methyltransferase [Bdellovibrionaceae bacterium]|nr:class I SAM-dependent methyltransferase [Pseudobdellovibrionaceae bacterium]
MSEIHNRLEKNLRRLAPWAERHHIEAYRLYERDLPDYPFLVDRYKDRFVVYDRSDERIDRDEKKRAHLPGLLDALVALFANGQLGEAFLRERVVIKRRERQKGESQYEKLGESGENFAIRESQARFWVNLEDYLDTGLFLDHRLMRQRVFETCQAGQKFLNLFSYTGSVSVFAALKGARTTSVDLSATYTRWAMDNFQLNDLNPKDHEFIQANALEFLADAQNSRRGEFDVIFLDPPTFSNSKRMQGTFDVERDQVPLVERTMTLLKPGGLLFFSNNKRGFRLSSVLTSQFQTKDIGAQTLPKDFRDPKLRVVYEFRHAR